MNLMTATTSLTDPYPPPLTPWPMNEPNQRFGGDPLAIFLTEQPGAYIRQLKTTLLLCLLTVT